MIKESCLTKHDIGEDYAPPMSSVSPPDVLFAERVNGYSVIEDDSILVINNKSIAKTEILVPGVQFAHFVYQQDFSETFNIDSDKPYFSMVYSLGPTITVSGKNEIPISKSIEAHQYGMFYIENHISYTSIEAKKGDEVIVINFSVPHFEKFIPNNHLFYARFEDAKSTGITACLNDENMQINRSMRQLLDAIIECEHIANYRFLHMKSKVIELLLQQFISLEKKQVTESIHDLSSSNREKMYEARDIIMSNLSRPCSLMDLAKQVGTNECYLKKQFKQVFGNTVYGYLHEKRMEKSKELLQEEQSKVSEVAKSIGYKHGSHFAAAFKKYFGFLPNELRLFFPTLLSFCVDIQELLFVEEIGILV